MYYLLEATSTRSKVNQGATNSITRRPQVVVDQFPENQDVYFKPSVVPGNRSYAETVHSLRKVIIFGDSIPRGIRIHEFNSLVKKGYANLFLGRLQKNYCIMWTLPVDTRRRFNDYKTSIRRRRRATGLLSKMKYIIRKSYMLG